MPGNKIPVLPDGVSTGKWFLTPDGQVQLRANDTVLASGPADQSVATYDYDTPRYEHRDGTHCIITADGAVIDEATSKTHLFDRWTKLRMPHVPTAHHYVANVSIRYRTGNTLTELVNPPEWDSNATGKRDRYKGAVNEFTRLYLVDEEDAELNHDAFRDTFQTWYKQRLLNGTASETPLEKSPPGEKEFGVARPDHIETKRREENDQYVRYIRDHTWIYPPDIISPDLPFIDDTTDDT